MPTLALWGPGAGTGDRTLILFAMLVFSRKHDRSSCFPPDLYGLVIWARNSLPPIGGELPLPW